MKDIQNYDIKINEPFRNVIQVVQNDTLSRYIRFNFRKSDGTYLDITNHVARIYCIKPDGTRVYNDLTIENAPNGIAILELTSQMLAVPGSIMAQLSLYGADGSILTTKNLIICVDSSLRDASAVESSNEFKALDKALNEVTQIKADITNRTSNDFLSVVSLRDWYGQSISSGTSAIATSTPKHPGVMSYSSSASANSGYRVQTDNSSIFLNGGEKTTFIFKTATVLTGVTRYLGFAEATGAEAPSTGVWINISDGIVTGKTKDSLLSTTGTSYMLASDTWYRVVIQLNNDATLVTFTLFTDDSNLVLWQDTISTNIPKGAGKVYRHGDVCFYSGTTAIIIGYLDYVDIALPNARRVI